MADDSFSESDIDGWSMSDSEGYESTKPAQAPLLEAGGEGEEEEVMFSMVTEDAGEQTMAIRPWLGAIVAPSDYNPSDPPRQPPGGLSAEWVYGFRGHDVRNNLIILPSGELMYPMAAVVILYDAGSHTQRHYFGHTDDIISVAAHPGGTVAASGEVGNYSPIRVWSTETLETFHVLDGHRKGVNALDFLADERLLASVSADDQRTVHVWDWEAGGAPVASSGHNHRVYALKANPADGSQFVTTGKNSVSFWSVDAAAGTVSMKKGIFGKKGKLQPIVSVAFTPKGTAVTGGKLGGLYLWVGGTVKDKRRAHRAPVYMLMSNSEGVISGGGDGLLKFWDFRFNNTKTIDIHTLSPLPSVRTAVRAAWWDAPSGRVVVGTKASEVFEFGADTDGSDANLLIQGHFNKELWGLAMHPSNPDVFATAGEDKTVRVWDGGAHRQTNCTVVTDEARCIDYSPDGTLLAIGLKDGSFVLMNADGLDLVANAKDRREWIEEVKFSPSGSMLAVGSHDTKIDVYTVPHLERVATCSGHSSTILHIDWSADESVLQTVSQAYEILWFDPQSGQQLTNATGLKDTEWATFTCKFGFPVQGIWPSRAHDKSDINTVDRSHSGDALVTGDDWGMVKVFGCPCVNEGDRYNEGAPFADFGGHSAHVTKTRFNADDSRVVSTGGGEHSIFQWAYTS